MRRRVLERVALFGPVGARLEAVAGLRRPPAVPHAGAELERRRSPSSRPLERLQRLERDANVAVARVVRAARQAVDVLLSRAPRGLRVDRRALRLGSGARRVQAEAGGGLGAVDPRRPVGPLGRCWRSAGPRGRLPERRRAVFAMSVELWLRIGWWTDIHGIDDLLHSNTTNTHLLSA